MNSSFTTGYKKLSAKGPGRESRGKKRRDSGQSIILAVMVMFLLLFLGGIFIAVLRRNMARTERSGEQLNAQQLAEAGLKYASEQLSSGAEGADWRPEPEFPPFGVNVSPGCTDIPVTAPNANDVRSRLTISTGGVTTADPDIQWLRPWASQPQSPNIDIDDTRAELVGGQYPKISMPWAGPEGGFSRVTYGGGRFLVRVTYNPNNNPAAGPVLPDATDSNKPSPLSRFIMIEVIGREGIVDSEDPTTYVQQNLKRTLVAFKPIGITDYARFITDRQQTGNAFTLGASKFPLIDNALFPDDTAAQNAGVPGRIYSSEYPNDANLNHVHKLNTIYGPFRSNGGLQVRGEPMIVLNQNPQPDGSLAPVPGRGDKVEIAGRLERADDSDLALAGVRPDGTTVPRMKLWNTNVPTASPTNPGPDLYVEGVNRLEAPDITAVDPSKGVPRYRLLTRFSTPVIPGLSLIQSEVAARNGLGSGIYLENRGDVQEGLGYSLEKDWVNPNGSKWWSEDSYAPPGAVIQLLPSSPEGSGPEVGIPLFNDNWVDGKRIEGAPASGLIFKRGLIKITRTDRTWRVPDPLDPNNRDGRDTTKFTQYFQYPLLPNEQPENPQYPVTFTNGVIYAEGNVRVWGKLPQDRSNSCFPGGAAGQRLTIVSNATIYVEGSLLKGDPAGPSQPQRSGLAVLARDYVAVNATNYFAAQEPSNQGKLLRQPPDQYAVSILNSVDAILRYPLDSVSALVAPPPATSEEGQFPNVTEVRQMLFTQAQGASSSSGAGLTLAVNPTSNGTLYHRWWEVINEPGLRRLDGHAVPSDNWNYEVTPFSPFLNTSQWFMTSVAPNFLRFSIVAEQPATLARVAVSPLDVRIEAAIYAMNGSFYIIPGVPFNNDTLDKRSSFVHDNREQRHGSMARYLESLDRRVEEATGQPKKHSPTYPYPFSGEPLDIKIMVLGTVAENKPAPPNAQEEWARLWGWTPTSKAAQNARTAHGGDGLTFQFDPSLRESNFRVDQYGRALPLMPRLPVSPDLVYSGEAQ